MFSPLPPVLYIPYSAVWGDPAVGHYTERPDASQMFMFDVYMRLSGYDFFKFMPLEERIFANTADLWWL